MQERPFLKFVNLLMKHRRIRLFFIISSFAVEGPQGGAELFCIELAKRLAPARFAVTVCGLWRHGLDYEDKWMDELRCQGIQVLTTSPWTGVRRRDASTSLRFLRRYFRDGRQVDIVNSHSAFADIAALWLRLIGATQATVRTLHSEREWYRHPVRGVILNHVIFPLAFDVETGVSRRVVANLDRRLLAWLLRRQAQVIHNAIDHERLADLKIDIVAKKKSLGLALEGPVIGNVGRFTKQKGHIYFLEMAHLLLKRDPRCQFILIGTGELLPEMQVQARDLGLGDRLLFLGPRSDVEELLKVMDVFVSSSLWEGLPTVLLEAMAAGVPVVATDVSGSEELVKDDHTGLLVPPANADSLSDAVWRLLHDPELAKRLVVAGQQWSRQFTIDSSVEQYEALFESIYGRETQL
jgi:glycosyltransferase involved in cell wall biosynthesis